jgi:hypothetical protein
MEFAKQTNGAFCIEPLNRSAQCITNPSNIPTTKEGVELYYQHRILADGIRGKSLSEVFEQGEGLCFSEFSQPSRCQDHWSYAPN